jgi:tetratricopeptide (TPR) repeat protein
MTQQGRSAIERGDWTKAETLLSRATESCPIESDARRFYAKALWQRGAHADALRQMREAVENSPDDAALVLEYGQMQLDSGHHDDGWRAANRALEIDAQLADAWRLRGRVLRAMGQWQGALSNYQRGLAASPNDRQLLWEIAEIYEQMNQPERTLVSVQCLLDLHAPGEEPLSAIQLQGACLSKLGRHNDAIDLLASACERGTPSVALLGQLGKCQVSAGRLEAAQATLQQAQAMYPSASDTQNLQRELQVALQHDSGPLRR